MLNDIDYQSHVIEVTPGDTFSINKKNFRIIAFHLQGWLAIFNFISLGRIKIF
jgi:hypothetical protein